MDFAEQIKQIRKRENLTQEQFAAKLNVSRQAVSNWENNKNLPDIGLLMVMSEVFHISLDQLIKGEDGQSNMTAKVLQDGSETRRAKYNLITAAIGGALVLVGAALLVLKGMSVEYIDAEGFLHENFFLLPAGFACIFCGCVAFAAAGLRALVARWKTARRDRKQD